MLWFVSHCKTDSRREDYVAELSKYIHIDIYGMCGKVNACDGTHQENCVNVSVKEYKFYFSAENSICKEYITGMYFNTFPEFALFKFSRSNTLLLTSHVFVLCLSVYVSVPICAYLALKLRLNYEYSKLFDFFKIIFPSFSIL